MRSLRWLSPPCRPQDSVRPRHLFDPPFSLAPRMNFGDQLRIRNSAQIRDFSKNIQDGFECILEFSAPLPYSLRVMINLQIRRSINKMNGKQIVVRWRPCEAPLSSDIVIAPPDFTGNVLEWCVRISDSCKHLPSLALHSSIKIPSATYQITPKKCW